MKHIIVFCILLLFSGCSKKATGIEGNWIEVNGAEGKYNLIVDQVEYSKTDRYSITIKYRMENIDKNRFGTYEFKKHIVDSEGRMFNAQSGDFIFTQPLEVQERIIRYDLPLSVGIQHLRWIDASDNYEIEITPIEN
ncbi:MAG: hypothetical protein ACM3N1_00115 [Accumulibacter sp.]